MFCRPDVIRRVKSDFIALALRSPLVNEAKPAGDADEAELYKRIRRTMLAPQGIGILNSDGQVLVWVQMFESDKNVPEFLDHGVARFKDGARDAHCYMKFPSHKMEEIENTTSSAGAPRDHGKDRICPARGTAKSVAPKGYVVAELCGRALDKTGALESDTVRQENYVQDQFKVSPALQESIAKALADGRPLPAEFGRLCATHAHLGHIDVNPLYEHNKGELKRAEFRAQKSGDGLWRVEGATEVAGEMRTNGSGEHTVALAWEGFIEMDGAQMKRLLLFARGTERLKFENGPRDKGDESAFLPGGRPIDKTCAVRYGVVGVPGTLDATADPSGSFRAKMEKLGPLVDRRRKEGGDLEPLHRLLQKIEPLMKENRFAEAERIMDEALKLVGEEGSKAIPWLPDLAAAQKAAREQKKLVLQFLMLGDLDDPKC